MSSYRYAGVPLLPEVCIYLIRDLGIVGPVRRAELIKTIEAEHLERGGAETKANPVMILKKALQQMQSAGEAEQVVYGHWRMIQPTSAKDVTEPVEVGEGSQCVYVYYYPAYRDQAAYLRREDWPMKIGMSTSSRCEFRIREQGTTAMPEAPIIGLIYRTDNAADSERILHATLRSRGKHLSGAPGREWFNTSLKEVREILDFANPPT